VAFWLRLVRHCGYLLAPDCEVAAMTATRPADLLTLREAASLVQRSPNTIRRWRAEHGLRDYRDAADPTAPSLVSRAELLDLAARVEATRGGADGVIVGVSIDPTDPLAATPSPASRAPARRPVSTPHGQAAGTLARVDLALVGELAAALRADRDRALAERDAAVAELDRARLAVAELGARVATLETLVADGRRASLLAERDRLTARRGPPPAPPAAVVKPKRKPKDKRKRSRR